MAFDIVDLRSFYASNLGQSASAILCSAIRARWTSCVGQSVLGIGYASPFLNMLKSEGLRTLSFMPSNMGVVNWPSTGLSASALIDTDALPLPDSSIDRILLVHALENCEHKRDLLDEIWRVLTPGGRLIVITPSRHGWWAHYEHTPFGQGQPFSKGQLRDLMRDALFSPLYWSEALYLPPSTRQIWLRSAKTIEAIGHRLSLPMAGVHLVEATKQLYRPILARKQSRFRLPKLAPALISQRESSSSHSPRPQQHLLKQSALEKIS